jgi:uncharacterized membrane protein
MAEQPTADSRADVQAGMRRRVLVLMTLLGATVMYASWRSFAWPENLFVGVALLVPLLLPVPGILRAHRRTFAWATLCVTPYFIFGFTELVANPALRPAALGMLIMSLGLVAALVAYLRLTRPSAADQGS